MGGNDTFIGNGGIDVFDGGDGDDYFRLVEFGEIVSGGDGFVNFRASRSANALRLRVFIGSNSCHR